MLGTKVHEVMSGSPRVRDTGNAGFGGCKADAE